ncbi:hypothetical protein Cgig2_013225 [Carnegiea gigantea]|uniref:Uncharacterized protein n=1 Tax=Carnegiea gigantea TaxID=171969 RepID=A0A9Q1GIY2_9CARY|nr:hypothetical protein Cgig2_013225 [Carnegiea gigantea]
MVGPNEDLQYLDMVRSTYQLTQGGSKLSQIKVVLMKLKPGIRRLNREKFANLYAQQVKVKEELSTVQSQLLTDPVNQAMIAKEAEHKKRYITIQSPFISLIKQQCKIDRIQQGADYTRSTYQLTQGGSKLSQIKVVLMKLKPGIRRLNREKFANLYAQQVKVKEELSTVQSQLLTDPVNQAMIAKEAEHKKRYITIQSPFISLIKQQCKIDRIQQGADYTRFSSLK